MRLSSLITFFIASLVSFSSLASVTDPTKLPPAERQLPDWDAYEGLGVRTAGSGLYYSDPATGTKIFKLTDASTPETNSLAFHDYSEGGPLISREWGDNQHTILIRTWVSGQGMGTWLVDYEKGDVSNKATNWRQFPSGPYPFTDVTAAFANSPGSERILYFVAHDTLYRFNTETMLFEAEDYIPVGGLEIPNVGSRLEWLQTSKDDEWLVFQSPSVERVYAFHRPSGALLQRVFPDLDEPAVDRDGNYVLIRDGGGGDPSCPTGWTFEEVFTLWNLNSDTTSCRGGPVYAPHSGWVRGYFPSHQPRYGNSPNFYYDPVLDIAIETAEYAEDNAVIANHHASQWIQDSTGPDQWYYGSNFVEGRVRADGWQQHAGEIFVTTGELNWTPSYQKPLIGVRAVYQADDDNLNRLRFTLEAASSASALSEGTFYFDSAATPSRVYVWAHGGGNPTGRVHMAAPGPVHNGIVARRLDGTDIRLVAHHYTWPPTFEYREMPFATASPDGKLIMFDSNMGEHLGRMDVFLAEVPTDGQSPPCSPDPCDPPPGSLKPVVWTNVVNAIADGSSLHEDCACGDSGAQSTQEIAAGDGFVEFVAGSDHEIFAVGLSHGNTDNSMSDIDFALNFTWVGWAEIRENGAYRGDVPYVLGDRFRIAVENGAVNYYKYDSSDLVLIYSNTSPTVQYPLQVDTALLGPGTSVLDASISVDGSDDPPPSSGEITWVNVSNALADGNSLYETGGVGDAGAQSAETIVSGDGYIEFTAAETNTMRGIGLGVNNTSNDYADIEFAIVLWGNGWAEVRESGSYKWDIPYSEGDRFRIAIENGSVKYYKYVNDVLTLYYTNSSPSALAYPVFVDTALHSPGSTLVDVVLIDQD